jgi:hypothetical protein
MTEEREDVEAISLQEFLEDVPPREARLISGLAVPPTGHLWFLAGPDITLHCSDLDCGRPQNFRSITENIRLGQREQDFIIRYRCKSCERTIKLFALRLLDRDGADGVLMKIGEVPEFGPPLPARLQRLVQSDRDFLLKGFRSENEGLGIGAFAYYRRLVEEHKNKLIDEIIKTCRKYRQPKPLFLFLNKRATRRNFQK